MIPHLTKKLRPESPISLIFEKAPRLNPKEEKKQHNNRIIQPRLLLGKRIPNNMMGRNIDIQKVVDFIL